MRETKETASVIVRTSYVARWTRILCLAERADALQVSALSADTGSRSVCGCSRMGRLGPPKVRPDPFRQEALQVQ